MADDNESNLVMQVALKNADLALEHERQLAHLKESVKTLRGMVAALEENKANKSPLWELAKSQGWKALGAIMLATFIAWGSGLIDAVKDMSR